MTDFVKAVLGAQPYALFMVAGLFFIGVAIVGSIKTYFDPGDKGRIAAGAVGTVLLVVGYGMYRQQALPATLDPALKEKAVQQPALIAAAPPVGVARPEPASPRHVQTTTTPETASDKSPMDGTWRGIVEIPDLPLHFVLHVNGPIDDLSATGDSPDQQVKSLDVEDLKLTGNHVRFTMPYIGVEFNGTLNGNHIGGTFVQHGIRSRLLLTRD